MPEIARFYGIVIKLFFSDHSPRSSQKCQETGQGIASVRVNFMEIPRIKNATAPDAHTLIVVFTDGKRKKYDIRLLLDKEMFFPLKNFSFFKNFYIEPGGYAIVWNSDIDISEYELWKNGVDLP